MAWLQKLYDRPACVAPGFSKMIHADRGTGIRPGSVCAIPAGAVYSKLEEGDFAVDTRLLTVVRYRKPLPPRKKRRPFC